jgi:hypothetical protein
MAMEHPAGQIVSRGHIGPVQSMLFVDVVGTIGLLVVAAIALRRSLRQSRAAARTSRDAALAPGEAVIAGAVELEEGASVAVRVEVDQQGTESEESGVWSHQWIETDRRSRVRPFYLRHASGARVRVEPRADVTLFNALRGLVRVDLTKRVRVAELTPGDKVFVFGELHPEAQTPGHPPRGHGYTLVPPREGRMLVSSEPIAEAFARRAAFHRRWAVVAAASALTFNAFFASFHARRFLGETVDVRVTQLREYDDKDDNEHFSVTMQGAALFSDEVSRSDFRRLHEGDQIQVRDVPSWRSAAAIGSHATAHSRAYFAVPLLALIALAYGLRTRATRPWYERKKLVDKGTGRLAESKPTAEDARKRAAGPP